MPSRYLSFHSILDVNHVCSNIRSLWLVGSYNQLSFCTPERTLAYASFTAVATVPKLRDLFRGLGFCSRGSVVIDNLSDCALVFFFFDRVRLGCSVFSRVLYNVNVRAYSCCSS